MTGKPNSDPYIGITGFNDRQQVQEVLNIWPRRAERKLMVGVLLSSNVLYKTKKPRSPRYPESDLIRDIFIRDERCLNLIHYNTKNPDNLAAELFDAIAVAGPNLDGFQLNIKWPKISELKKFREREAEQVIVLQVGARAFEEVDDSPTKMAEKVAAYSDLVNYVLLDQSGGKGLKMNAELLKPFVEEIRAQTSGELAIVAVGGLGPEFEQFKEPILELVKICPSLSIDAEGKLRDEADNLIVRAAVEYVTQALDFFSEFTR